MRLRDYQKARELILGLIRPDAKPEHLTKLAQGIGPHLSHWSEVLNVSYDNNALPLLYFTLHRSGLDTTIPEQAGEILLKSYLKNTRRTFSYQNELVKILTAFSNEGIPLMLLKGAIALIEGIYQDRNIRIMADLDLLIMRKNYEAAQKVLHGLEYFPEDNYRGEEDKIVFSKSTLKIVEIHFSPLGEHLAPYLPVEDVWSRALRKEKDGITFFLPSPTDQLYHLLVHEIIQHQRMTNYRILGMYEVYSLLAFYREEINFDVLFQRARRFNIEELFSIYLLLTEEKMGPILSPSMKDDIKSRAGKSLLPYEKVSQNPLRLNWASNRFFIVLSTSTGFSSYLKNAYRILIQESVFLKSNEFLLSLYGLKKLPPPFLSLLKGFHVARVLFLHLVIALFFLLRRTHQSDLM